MNETDSPICLKHKRKPFIVIDTYSNRKSSRQKRNINCYSGTTECCREKLFISFADIGWDDWILYPRGYDAYFCRGSCESAASVTMSGSHYSSVIRVNFCHCFTKSVWNLFTIFFGIELYRKCYSRNKVLQVENN